MAFEVTPEKTAMARRIMGMICGGKRKSGGESVWPDKDLTKAVTTYHQEVIRGETPSDEELVHRALNNSFRTAGLGKTRRAVASRVFGTGSSVSGAICRRYGFDPDECAGG